MDFDCFIILFFFCLIDVQFTHKFIRILALSTDNYKMLKEGRPLHLLVFQEWSVALVLSIF